MQYPTDVVLLVVLWRRRHKLRLRDLAVMLLVRGIVFTHETVRDREARCAPLLTARLRARRRGQAGTQWHVAETYGKANGRWCSRDRAIGRAGNPVEARRSARRDMAAARRFSTQALGTAGHAPAQVPPDGHDACPRAIRETLGPAAAHRCSRYKNNRIEQDRRGVQRRYSPPRGCGRFASAARCCARCEAQRPSFRPRAQAGAPVSLAERRHRFQERWVAVLAEPVAA